MSTRKRLLLFVNPAAGKEEIGRQLMDVISRFTAAGYIVTCHPTQKPRDIIEVIESHGAEYELIVTCGGDGTLNETVTGMLQLPAEARPLLGYIPAGTVNDFATSLNIPKMIPDAVTNILEGRPFPVDMGKFNDQYFTYVAAFGAFTKVSYATPHATKQAIGKAAYMLEAVRSLNDIQPIAVTARAGDQVIQDNVIVGMITNATSVGGFKALDNGYVKMDDGFDELILIRAPKDLVELNSILGCLLTRDFSPEWFYILQAESVTLEFEKPVPWTLDGEYGGETDHAEIANIPTPIQILVPKETENL